MIYNRTELIALSSDYITLNESLWPLLNEPYQQCALMMIGICKKEIYFLVWFM